MKSNNPRLRKNNFDLLRLFFAVTVCFAHAYNLSGDPQLFWTTYGLSAPMAVKSFFVISGFLIFMSFERSSSVLSYAVKRIRRIYPAYFTVIMLCAVGMVVVSSKAPAEYFSTDWIKYIFANLLFLNFLQPTLVGVFDSNKLAEINGALWTLKIEVMFYFSVPIFVLLCRRFGYFLLIATSYCLSVVYYFIFAIAAKKTGLAIYYEIGRQLPGQFSYFMVGAFFYYYLTLFERYVYYFLFAALSIIFINTFFSLSFFEPFALGTIVMFFGLFFYVGNFGKYGDFSYGIYILHFPIIQLFLNFRILTKSSFIFLITSFLCTLFIAMAMWHLVEKQFLRRSNYYVNTTG